MSAPLLRRLLLNVGGFRYEVEMSLLQKYPDSFLAKLLNPEWKEASDPVISIERDGPAFQHVYEFLCYGMLPRNQNGYTLLDRSQLEAVQAEAEFYQLPDLVRECQNLLNSSNLGQVIETYASVYAQTVGRKNRRSGYVKLSPSQIGPEIDRAWKAIRSPSWLLGTLDSYDAKRASIYKSSTVDMVHLEELLTVAKPSPFGRGTETVMDLNVRDSLEIPASELNDLSTTMKRLNVFALAPHMKLKLVPYKLVIYRQGGHFDDHRDTVRTDKHVGTLVLILNSAYTGGELEVSHCSQSVSVTGPLHWVAMYGDCVHRIHPVFSGTRVSLIFDIINESEPNTEMEEEKLEERVGKKLKKMEDKDANEDGNEEEDDEDNDEEDEDKDNDATDSFDHWSYGSPSPFVLCEKMAMADIHPKREVDAQFQDLMYLGLDKKLKNYDTVSFCLKHLYPACQAKIDLLKGTDYLLYCVLKDKYDVAVTPITLSVSNGENSGLSMGFEAFSASPNNSKSLEILKREEKNALIISEPPSEDGVMHYNPEIEYTGNESQELELVYLLAALVVRKRA